MKMKVVLLLVSFPTTSLTVISFFFFFFKHKSDITSCLKLSKVSLLPKE